MAFDLFYPIRMAGFRISALIFAPIGWDKTEGKENKQGHSYRLPALRANIEFPKGTYQVCRQANISTKRRSENGNPFTLHL